MSEAADNNAPEEFDLSEVPMDGEADEAPAEGQEGAETDGEGDPPAAKAKPPLAAEELSKRYSSTKIALTTERAKRREAERELADFRAGRAPAERAPQQRQEAQSDEEIDPDVDPVGALKQATAKIRAYEQSQRIEERSADEQRDREAKLSRVEAELREYEIDYADDHPDYGDAATHYAVSRAQELMQFGLKPTQIEPMLREEFATLVANAIRNGKNPAAVVYEMAKGRGYGKAALAPKDGKSKIDTIQRGQRAQSPMRASGGGNGGLDPKTVGNINIRSKAGRDAFSKAFDAMESRAMAAERGR